MTGYSQQLMNATHLRRTAKKTVQADSLHLCQEHCALPCATSIVAFVQLVHKNRPTALSFECFVLLCALVPVGETATLCSCGKQANSWWDQCLFGSSCSKQTLGSSSAWSHCQEIMLRSTTEGFNMIDLIKDLHACSVARYLPVQISSALKTLIKVELACTLH